MSRLIFALLVAAAPAQAQVLYGSAVGTLQDPTGSVIPNATVTMTKTATSQVRETVSTANGGYTFANLEAGAYDLKVTATGFRTFTKTRVEISINTVTRNDVRLELGQVADQITVEGQATALQTDKSDIRAEISGRAVSNLPLASYRNFQSLINLVPGATPANFQNSVGSTPARALTTNVNGTARNNNNTRVDGATNVYIWLPHNMVYVPPVESISTVNISTGSFDAEQGMAGGAAVTVSTKSGTNDLHGSAFHYHDNQTLRSRNFFLPATSKKAKAIFNIFGGTLGGPIVKNKLFYFGSFEGTLERAGISPTPYSLPTAGIRAGDFGGQTATIYDPRTGSLDGTNRQVYPNNRIPANLIHPISNRIQALAPLPNLPGTSNGTLQNYFAAGTEALNRYNYDTKVNWNPSSSLMIWGKYSRMDAFVTSKFAFGDQLGGPGLSRAGAPEVSTTDVNIYTGGFNKTLSPTFLLDGTLALTRMDLHGSYPGYGKNIGSEVWGIPNTNDPITVGPAPERVKAACPAIANNACYSGMPSLSHGFTTWGATAGWQPHFYNERSLTYTTNFTKMKGPHEIRFGFELVRLQMDQWQPEVSGGPRGGISFSGDVTGARGYTSNFLNQYATFLLGLTTNMTKAVQLFQMTNREWQYGWYVRDRWQVSRRLTLNLGLRYEYFPLIYRAGGRGIERWDPATNLVYMGGVGNNPRNVGITSSKKLFAPRFGFAFRLNDSTVIRSGYGSTYDPLPFSRPLRGMYPATIGSTFVSSGPFAWIDTLDKGIPAIPIPDTSTGVLTLPPTVDMGPRSAWGGEINRGYIQSWNFTIERKLAGDFVTSVGYVGTQTVHQLIDRDINAAPPGGGPAGRPLAATQNRRIAALMWDGMASGNYHGLQIAVNRQFSRGLLVKGAYTYSKAINWTDEDGWTGAPTWNWGPVMHRNRAKAGYNREQMFTLGALYELPFGPGKTFNTAGPISHLTRGWQINGTMSVYSGTPFTIGANGTELNSPGNTQTADQVKEMVSRNGEIGANKSWFDPLAFRQPLGVRFGTTGRNILFGPNIFNADLSLFRTFRITERVRMEFKAESFNFTNTPKFANPAANVANMALNADGSIRALNNFSSITSTLGNFGNSSERQFRFGLRIGF